MTDSNKYQEMFTEITGEESLTESQEEDVDRVVTEESAGPTTAVRCPECGNDTAYYEMKQIRAADESETRFFTCTECKYKWREDDH